MRWKKLNAKGELQEMFDFQQMVAQHRSDDC
jgi:hypothetical protein